MVITTLLAFLKDLTLLLIAELRRPEAEQIN